METSNVNGHSGVFDREQTEEAFNALTDAIGNACNGHHMGVVIPAAAAVLVSSAFHCGMKQSELTMYLLDIIARSYEQMANDKQAEKLQ